MDVVAVIAVVLVASVGAATALVDLAHRDMEPWLRVAWVAVILSFPLFGPAAYAAVEKHSDVFVAWQRGAAAIFVILCGAALFWFVQDILPPFVIAFFLAALLDPVVTKLQLRGVSRGRAVGSIYLLVIVWIVIVAWFVVPSAMRQMGELAGNANVYTDTFTKQADAWYEARAKTLSGVGWTKKPSELLYDRSVTDYLRRLLEGLKDALVGFAGQIIWLVIIPLSLFYFLMDFQRLRTGLLGFVSEKQRGTVDRISNEIVEVFGHYIRSLAIVCVLYGASFAIIFSFFGLSYALFVGLAAGALYAVPYVGPATTLVSTVIISLAMGRSPAMIVATAVAFLVVHVGFDYGITPRVVGGSVGLHPIVNVFALMAGAALFGVWGMLLAVPVAASIQKLLVYFYPGRFTRETTSQPRGRRKS
jgi:predicted PurR-regulated permease PerM